MGGRNSKNLSALDKMDIGKTIDHKDLKISQLTQANDSLIVKIKQLSVALETSLAQRKETNQLLVQYRQELDLH
jgi:hypothetical protein